MDPWARQRPSRMPEGAGQWTGPPIDLFPSRAYGEAVPSGQRASRLSPPRLLHGDEHIYGAQPPNEVKGSPSNVRRDFPSSSPCSRERIGPPVNSAVDHLIPQQKQEGLTPSESTREWVAVTAYQPVDIVTRTVEVPVTRTVDVFVPKPVVREKIVEVPKLVPKYIEKIVEVPQVEWVERVVEIPEVVYKTKIVPKVELRENIVEKPVFHQKWVDKIVEVAVVEEVIRYRTIHEPEEIIKYIPRGHNEEEWRGAPILTVPPHQTPELPPKWGGTPQPSPRHPLVQAANQRSE